MVLNGEATIRRTYTQPDADIHVEHGLWCSSPESEADSSKLVSNAPGGIGRGEAGGRNPVAWFTLKESSGLY